MRPPRPSLVLHVALDAASRDLLDDAVTRHAFALLELGVTLAPGPDWTAVSPPPRMRVLVRSGQLRGASPAAVRSRLATRPSLRARLVLTATAPPAAGVVDPWRRLWGETLCDVVVDDDPAALWRAFGAAVGFGTRSLALPVRTG
ncbi:hypothetical protein [Nocardioides sp.]|uniref:hypothetical protein n=1 Tax=Nocardioides sp. TaxID=35761 RepID=UPI0035162B40